MEQQKSSTKKERVLSGIVVSDKMAKTRVVAVVRLKQHPKYLKRYTVTTRFQAHDEDNAYHVGDSVTIAQTRPMSRHKRWIITGKL